MTRHLRFTTGDNPTDTVIELDGQDVTKHCRGITIASDAWNPIPTVHLDLLMNGFAYDGGAHVGVSPEVGRLLEELGWTPPGGEA